MFGVDDLNEMVLQRATFEILSAILTYYGGLQRLHAQTHFVTFMVIVGINSAKSLSWKMSKEFRFTAKINISIMQEMEYAHVEFGGNLS